MVRARRPALTRGARPRARSRLIVVSNRLPFAFRRAAGGRWRAEPGSGGLVTALLPVLRDRGGHVDRMARCRGPGARLRSRARPGRRRAPGTRSARSRSTRRRCDNFYLGFSNEIIWPLFHDLPSLCNFDPAYWRSLLRR